MTGSKRWSYKLRNDGDLGADWRHSVSTERVSDESHWKDLTPPRREPHHRLLPTDLQLQRQRRPPGARSRPMPARSAGGVPANGGHLDALPQPLQRSPQIRPARGRSSRRSRARQLSALDTQTRLEGGLELEFNRFDLPGGGALQRLDSTGSRAHLDGAATVARQPMGGGATCG